MLEFRGHRDVQGFKTLKYVEQKEASTIAVVLYGVPLTEDQEKKEKIKKVIIRNMPGFRIVRIDSLKDIETNKDTLLKIKDDLLVKKLLNIIEAEPKIEERQEIRAKILEEFNQGKASQSTDTSFITDGMIVNYHRRHLLDEIVQEIKN